LKAFEKQKPVSWSNQRPTQKSVAAVVEAKGQQTAPKGKASQDDDRVKQCLVHSETKSHNLLQCRSFSEMPSDERWRIARDNGLCFNCLEGKHSSRQCKQKPQCDKCSALHHALLHRDTQQGVSQSAAKSSALKESATPSKPGINRANKGKPKVNKGTLGSIDTCGTAKEQIGIMRITAVRYTEDGQGENFIPFYAAIDTGATRSLCSHELGLKL